MKKKTTERGFELYEFEDDYGEKCSIQESSSIIPHLWIGLDKVRPIIRHSDVNKNPNVKSIGWVDYPIHPDVFIGSRMHLNVEQVKDMIKVMQKFVDENEEMEND